MKIALIADGLTREALAPEARLLHLTPGNYKRKLRFSKPDFLLVESSWQGVRNAWKYGIAAYPDHPERSNDALARVVQAARDKGIPTVFWNKEDGVHFDRFIASAQLFDHVFTVDENCLPRYRKLLRPEVTVDTLMFAVQTKLHYATHTPVRYKRANFVGSYSHHVHDTRRERQDMLFDAAMQSGLGLTVYDRNSARRSVNYRYPEALTVKPAVPYHATAPLYRDYLASLNVNTIEDSPSMFSRRLVEIIACGGLAITTPAQAASKHFGSFCEIVSEPEQARTLMEKLKREGRSPAQQAMLRAGADHVRAHYNWQHRLQQIARTLGL